jgi:hypothetical protein
MKKITLLLIAIFATFSMQSFAQNCTPDHTGYTVVPDTGVMLPRPLPNATVNVAYQQAVTIGVPNTVVYMNQSVPLNWIKLDSVVSSLGNVWAVVNSTGGTTFPQWAKDTWQCATILGTPTHSGMDSITVYIDGEVVVFTMPYTVTGQPGGKLPLFIQTPQSVGADYMDTQVSVFPNPSVDGNYSITVDQQYDMTICDVTGRVVSVSSINEGVSVVDLSNEVAGIYFVRLKNENQSKVIRLVRK